MRHLLPIGCLLFAACNDTAYQTWGVPDEPPVGEMVTISGVVSDSLLGGNIPEVRVSSGKFDTHADAGGLWSLTVPKGRTTISATPAGYEPVSYTFEALGSLSVSLLARRLAPAVLDCVRDGDSVHALLIDLQGRKTIERWNQSSARVNDPAGSYLVGAINWKYEALDDLTWRVTLVPVSSGTALINWDVYDSDGHRFTGACEPAEVPSHE